MACVKCSHVLGGRRLLPTSPWGGGERCPQCGPTALLLEARPPQVCRASALRLPGPAGLRGAQSHPTVLLRPHRPAQGRPGHAFSPRRHRDPLWLCTDVDKWQGLPPRAASGCRQNPCLRLHCQLLAQKDRGGETLSLASEVRGSSTGALVFQVTKKMRKCTKREKRWFLLRWSQITVSSAHPGESSLEKSRSRSSVGLPESAGDRGSCPLPWALLRRLTQ